MVQYYRQITVADMAPHIHVFKYGENKVNKLSEWMIGWIEQSLKSDKIHLHDKLPSKGELACHIGVSLGTMQNVFRVVEDRGYIYSKQKSGTFICKKDINVSVQKLTSKREFAAEKIKKYLQDNHYKNGDALISTRKLANIINCSGTTIRIAIGTLVSEGILRKSGRYFIIDNINFKYTKLEMQTLCEKITDNIRQWIKTECMDNQKLPSNKELAKKFNVSIKTIHDSIKILSKEGLVNTKRGQYGTFIIKSNDIAQELYCYEKAELEIKNYIMHNCQVGSKLPSIRKFSDIIKVSSKTIKKALDNLADDGYVTTVRGRLGGTFVTDIPQNINEAYKWLILNPDYIART